MIACLPVNRTPPFLTNGVRYMMPDWIKIIVWEEMELDDKFFMNGNLMERVWRC